MTEIEMHLEIVYKNAKTRYNPQKIRFVHIWFSRKDLVYPYNYLGSTEMTVSKPLGISKIEAGKLMIPLIEEYITSCDNEEVIFRLKWRIGEIKRRLGIKTIKSCLGCGRQYEARTSNQKYCKNCGQKRKIAYAVRFRT